jgi:virginiamycin B lyase
MSHKLNSAMSIIKTRYADWLANAIQRCDPNTATYTTFPSDKKGADVRQMLGRPGEVD